MRVPGHICENASGDRINMLNRAADLTLMVKIIILL